MKKHKASLTRAAQLRLARFLEKVEKITETERTTASKSTPEAAQIAQAPNAQADVHPAITA